MFSPKCSKKEFLFGLMIIMFISSVIFEATMWASRPYGMVNGIALLLKSMRYVAYLLAIIIIIDSRPYKKKIFRIIMAAFFLIILNMICSSKKDMLIYMFLFIAAIGVPSKYLINCTFKIQTVMLVLIVGAAILGIVDNYCFMEGERIRYFLGFSWTTTAPVIYFYLLFQYIFLKEGKLKFKVYLVFIIIDLFFYHMTHTRMTFAFSVLFLTFFLLYPKWLASGMLVNKLKYIFITFPFIAALCSIIATAAYRASNPIWSTINSILNGRLNYGKSGMENYGITLFGQSIEWIGNSYQSLENGYRGVYNYVDCSYMQILIEYGVLFLILVLIVYTALIYMSIKKEKYYISWIVVFILFFSITEPRLVNLAFNPFILICATEWDCRSVDKICLINEDR